LNDETILQTLFGDVRFASRPNSKIGEV